MNTRKLINHILAAMVIAVSASACVQEGMTGDEAVTDLEVAVFPEQPDELMATRDEASSEIAGWEEVQPGACPGPEACQPVDVPTAIPCNLTADCPTDHYCHPYTRLCNFADGEQCQTSAQCASFGADFYCHDRRCHPLTGDACTTNTCPSGQYCHVGICHADACSMTSDCPDGLNCSTARNVCRIP